VLDDEPLPFAYIQSIPQLDHFGAEANSTTTIDG